MANYVNKQHSLVESRNKNQANKTFLLQSHYLVMKSNVLKSRQEGAGLGWKSYVDDLLNGLTPWCNLPHIIVGIPSKEPK
jgi:hypothetical protein